MCRYATEFGYAIIQTLVTDIAPDQKVKIAMNEINAAQRQRVAAQDRAEAGPSRTGVAPVRCLACSALMFVRVVDLLCKKNACE